MALNQRILTIYRSVQCVCLSLEFHIILSKKTVHFSRQNELAKTLHFTGEDLVAQLRKPKRKCQSFISKLIPI